MICIKREEVCSTYLQGKWGKGVPRVQILSSRMESGLVSLVGGSSIFFSPTGTAENNFLSLPPSTFLARSICSLPIIESNQESGRCTLPLLGTLL